MSRDALLRYLETRSHSDFADVYEEMRPAVLAVVRRILDDDELAEDVTQEVFAGVLRSKWRPEDVQSGKGFLISQAISAARTRKRSEQRRRERERQRELAPAASRRDVLSQDDVWDIELAIQMLPRDLNRSVELRYYGGLTVAGVAATLGISVTTAKKRLAEAHGRLRERLAPLQANRPFLSRGSRKTKARQCGGAVASAGSESGAESFE